MPIIIGKPNGTASEGGGSNPAIENRLTSVENVNTQQTNQIESIQTKDTQQDTEIMSLNSKVDGVSSTATAQAERLSNLEESFVDYAPDIQAINAKNVEQDGLIVTANGKNDEQDVRITDAESSITSQGLRITSAESTLTNKADLVSGKIPLSQLPDLPVGRKVSVANEAARLALPIHPDLTIAYESDTADAWALDAGEDPSVPANWDKLGNAQATGVQSFNGRTGNVTPTTGDYTTTQITPTADRSFISDSDRVRWDNKSTPVQVEAAISTLRTEVQAGYVKTTSLAANNGVATLGSDGKVPTAQLPPLGLSSTQLQRLNEIDSLARLADAKGDSAATNILAVDNRLTQVDNDSKTRDTNQTNRITALESANANYIPLTQKAAANGVAPLNASSKVPTTNLPVNTASGVAGLDANGKLTTSQIITNVANGVPLLDSSGKILASQLPDNTVPEIVRRELFVYTSPTRVKDVTYTNDTGYEIELYISSTTNSTNGSISLLINPGISGQQIQIDSGSLGTAASNKQFISATIPIGSTYRVITRDPDKWTELRRVSTVAIPAYNANRVWRDQTGIKLAGLWHTNTSPNEMELYIVTNNANDSGYVSIQMRQSSSTALIFAFIGNSVANVTSGPSTRAFNTVSIPPGWQYAVNSGNLGARTIVSWYELS